MLMLPDLLHRYCDRIGVSKRARPEELRQRLLKEHGVQVSRRAVYTWFQAHWNRPGDNLRPVLTDLFRLTAVEELELYQVINRGPMTKQAA